MVMPTVLSATRVAAPPVQRPDPGAHSPGAYEGPGAAARGSAASSVLTAGVGVLVLGADLPLPHSTSTGLVVVLVLLPVWIYVLPRYSGARALLALALAALLSGLDLTWTAGPGRSIDLRHVAELSTLLVTAFGGVGLLLWARTHLSLPAVAALYAAGKLLVALAQVPGSPNAWKFQLAFPTTVLVLAAVARTRSRTWTVLSLVALGLVGVSHQYRSFVVFCVVAAALSLFGARRGRRYGALSRRVQVLILLGALSASAYFLGSAALVDGYAGKVLQQRSVEQITRSGSLLVGGRPEWSATIRLMREQPGGFGVGVVPRADDVWTGRGGLAAAGLPPDPVRDRYMFDGQFRLHSVLADLWVNCGAVGIALGVLIAGLLLNGLSVALVRRRASALVGFLVVISLWDLVFGPIHTNLADVALALGLVLRPWGGAISRSRE